MFQRNCIYFSKFLEISPKEFNFRKAAGLHSLRKPIDFHLFKRSCWTCLVFSCVYCFFLKWWIIQRYLFCMNKPYFCRDFFLIDWLHKRLKNKIALLLFYGEKFYGFSESAQSYSTLIINWTPSEVLFKDSVVIAVQTLSGRTNNFLKIPRIFLDPQQPMEKLPKTVCDFRELFVTPRSNSENYLRPGGFFETSEIFIKLPRNFSDFLERFQSSQIPFKLLEISWDFQELFQSSESCLKLLTTA